MKIYEFDGYTISLQDTGEKGEYDKARVAYRFRSPDGKVIFEGRDLFPSPMHSPESLESAKALLSFLTLREGDTDPEYFDKYTSEQLEFSRSMDCENLQLYAYEDEDYGYAQQKNFD